MAINEHIFFYSNNPTKGLKDGIKLTDSLSITTDYLNTNTNEIGTPIKIAIRTDLNKATKPDTNTTISIDGTSKDKWSLSKDNLTWSNWGESLVISEQITDVNTILYARSKATSDEDDPTNDSSVSLKIAASIISTVQ